MGSALLGRKYGDSENQDTLHDWIHWHTHFNRAISQALLIIHPRKDLVQKSIAERVKRNKLPSDSNIEKLATVFKTRIETTLQYYHNTQRPVIHAPYCSARSPELDWFQEKHPSTNWIEIPGNGVSRGNANQISDIMKILQERGISIIEACGGMYGSCFRGITEGLHKQGITIHAVRDNIF